MKRRSFAHLGDQELLRALDAAIRRESASTAEVLALIAEVDARKLYLPAGYSSMFLYCLHELHLCEEAAFKRIHAARTAHRFPAIFDAVAEGRLHLSGVVTLAPHLTPENAGELLAAAALKTRAELQRLLAQRFPRPDLPTRVEALARPPAPARQTELAPESTGQHAPGRVETLQSPTGQAAEPRPKATPLSAQRYAWQLTVGQSAQDKLGYAQALLGHQVPCGDMAEVLEQALDALIEKLEKQKFAATTRPRPQGSSADPRHIPAAVKRAVWERDGGECTFMSEGGRRCGARTGLEYDHVDPVARGGEATVEGIRLRCRPHNLYEAELVFGAGFMASKREAARHARAEARARAAVEADPDRSVVPWLRRLGFRLSEAREAAAACAGMADAPLEERIRAALRHFPPRTVAEGRVA